MTRFPADAFLNERGEPRLIRCAVLFVDILGVREMNRSPEAEDHLVALDDAVSRTYRDFLSPQSPWPASSFSDLLVLAAPCDQFGGEHLAVDSLVTQAAILQYSLAITGLFARGGLALGAFHIHEGLVFGPALVDAYEIETTRAVHPRVVLADDAYDVQGELSVVLNELDPAPAPLMRDEDGAVFVDYLGFMFDDPDAHRLLTRHRDAVKKKLSDHRGERRIWEKFRWVAEYHNARLEDAPHDFRDAIDIRALKVAQRDYTWSFHRFP